MILLTHYTCDIFVLFGRRHIRVKKAPNCVSN